MLAEPAAVGDRIDEVDSADQKPTYTDDKRDEGRRRQPEETALYTVYSVEPEHGFLLQGIPARPHLDMQVREVVPIPITRSIIIVTYLL